MTSVTKKIIWVAGARPNFMKIAPIWRAMERWNRLPDRQLVFDPRLVHTGQHYDTNMSDVFFQELQLPQPDYFLGVGSGTHAEQTGRVMVAFEQILATEKPDWVGVVGDVNSTAACALVTTKSYVLPEGRTPVLIHVEAGLRSGDRLMPEEVNRLVTDVLADRLFTTESAANENLIREGVAAERVTFVGNVMVDSLVEAMRSPHMADKPSPWPGQRYGVVTLHRPSNVDQPQMLDRIIQTLAAISRQVKLLMPVHPRTRARWQGGCLTLLESLDQLSQDSGPGLFGLPPLGYHDFLNLTRHAAFVITDSGGVQEETTVLGVPCLTLRDNTERPVTVELGTNSLVGRRPELLPGLVDQILLGKWKQGQQPPGWDGQAAQRIIEALGGQEFD